PRGVALRVPLFQARGDQVQLRLGLLPRHVRFQTRDDLDSGVYAAQPETRRREADGHGDVGFPLELEIRRSDADDGDASIVEYELCPNDAFIPAESAVTSGGNLSSPSVAPSIVSSASSPLLESAPNSVRF